jgi:hypothetical protein
MSLLSKLETLVGAKPAKSQTKAVRPRSRASAPPSAPVVEATPPSHPLNFVTSLVYRMDTTPEKRRIGKQYIHVSSLLGSCPRFHLLAFLSQREIVKKVQPSMRLVWKIGRACEAHVREQFIEAVDKKGVIGSWRCKCGHTKTEGLFSRVVCSKCESVADDYHEAALMDHKYRIVGSPDLLYLRPDNDKVRVVEFKSMNKKDFELLEAPLADHVHQAMSYARLLRDSGVDTDDEVSIIYICKDFQFSTPYREFHVPSSEENRIAIGSMWRKATEIAKGITKSATMPLTEVPLPARLSSCKTLESKTAKSCELCTLCFSRE